MCQRNGFVSNMLGSNRNFTGEEEVWALWFHIQMRAVSRQLFVTQEGVCIFLSGV